MLGEEKVEGKRWEGKAFCRKRFGKQAGVNDVHGTEKSTVNVIEKTGRGVPFTSLRSVVPW